jgi:hypothetical protein
MSSTSLLPDDLPTASRHVSFAILVVVAITICGYVLDTLVVEAIATEIAKLPIGETVWSRQLSILRGLLENLIAGAWAALLLALIVRWIITFVDPRDRVIEIAARAITARLCSNSQKTRRYIFIGNTATFVSATVLPILVDAARTTGIPRIVDLYLIDPMDDLSVNSYSAFKAQVLQANSGVADRNLGRWVQPQSSRLNETNDEVRAKVLAAIYLAAFSSLQSGVTVTIFLRRSFTPFRADMTDKEVVLTQESPVEPGVAFSESGVFYGWYYKEAEAQQIQASRIDLEGSRDILRLKCLTNPCGSRPDVEASIRDLVGIFSHLAALALNSTVIEAAAKRVMQPTHSY